MQNLVGAIKHYAWGSMSAIPHILGTEPTLEPQAEYWLGAHPMGPSSIAGQDLSIALERHPDWLGKASRKAFGNRLPYLLKILSAAQPLSLQAHPSRRQAESGFAQENAKRIPLDAKERTYKDPWPKPELIVALTDFHALCGFRPALQSAELFAQLGMSESALNVFRPLTQRSEHAGIAEVFLQVLGMQEQSKGLAEEVVAAAVRHTNDDGELGDFARTAVEIDEFYPASPGIIAALMLNRVHLKPGQGLYLPAGVMHAYLKGTGIEIMANSDNVIRGGLTSKHIDVDQLVSVVSFSASNTDLVPVEQPAPGLQHYVTPDPYFGLWSITPEQAPEQKVEVPQAGARILLCVSGSAQVEGDKDAHTLYSGQAVFLPAFEQATVSGNAQVFCAGAGV